MDDMRYLDQIRTEELVDEIKRRTNGHVLEITKNEWNALSDSEKAKYRVVLITDDYVEAIPTVPTIVTTTAIWNGLTPEEKNNYQVVYLTDDQESLGSEIVDAVTDGVMNPVTSNAVHDVLHGPRVVVSSFDDIPEIDNGNIFYTRIDDLIIVGGAVHLTARPSFSSIVIAKNFPEPFDYYSTLVPIFCINSTEDEFVPVCISSGVVSGTYDLYLFNQIIPLKAGWHRISGQYIAK